MASRLSSWESVTARQHGVLSRAQALQCGLSARQVEWLLTKGRWVSVFPGVYRSAGAPSIWPQALMAAVLWADGDAVVSHGAAAALWDLDGFRGAPVELSGMSGLAAPAGVVYHRVRRLDRADVEVRRGIRVTSVARTLLDLAGVVPERVLERALDECLRRRLAVLKHVEWCVERNGRRGREGIASLEAMLRERRHQATNDSPVETDAGAVFRRAGLPTPKRNHEVVVRGRLIARVDLAWVRERVAVQVHSAFHRQPRNWEKDQVVENLLAANGWMVLKVTKKMLEDDERAVAELVRDVLAERTRRPMGSRG